MAQKDGILENISFDIDRNKNLYAKIKLMDVEQIYTVYGGLHYAWTKFPQNKIKLNITRENFADIIVPQKFDDIFNSEEDFSKTMRKAFDNFRKALIVAKFGDVVEISPFEAKNRIEDSLKEYVFLRNATKEIIGSFVDTFSKEIVYQDGLKNSSKTMEVTKELTEAMYYAIKDLKGYKIVGLSEDEEVGE